MKTSKYPLYDELNETKHVHLCSEHACEFCRTKLRIPLDPIPARNTIFILPSEVALHNKVDDIWVSILGKVYDLTPLVARYSGEKIILPLLAFAGKDISHWFDKDTGDIQHYVHPVTGVKVPYLPHGPIPDVRTVVPNTSWEPVPDPPWWKNEKYLVGYLTEKARHVRIQNMLTRDICKIEVCKEDKLRRILERYMLFNSDDDSYTWCYEDRVLDLEKTLEENGIEDEREKFTEIGLPEDTYIPMLLLYYNDDLKWE